MEPWHKSIAARKLRINQCTPMAARKDCIPTAQAKAFGLGGLGMKLLNVSLKCSRQCFSALPYMPKKNPTPALDAGAALFFGERALDAQM